MRLNYKPSLVLDVPVRKVLISSCRWSINRFAVRNIFSRNADYPSDPVGRRSGNPTEYANGSWTKGMVHSIDQQHQHSHSQNRFAVVPTALRLRAHPNCTGRGVTIAFLDSGFYPHPDLTQPASRIIAYKDIANPHSNRKSSKMPEESDWHGTMTSVAAAGNGHLSNGLYRGLACDARLVLVKVSENGRITEPNIERGLRWVIKNKEHYNIRIVNISLGGESDVSYTSNAVDQAAEDAVKAGIVVVVAAAELSRRLTRIFLRDSGGRRPVFGSIEKFQTDPNWSDLILFHEYFHGDTGSGVGANHQTGWTGLVAKLIQQSGE